MHPDSDQEGGAQPWPQSLGGGDHVERKLRCDARMPAARRWNAGDGHVVVADCLYLFDSNVLGKLVEFAEQMIQAADNLKGLHARRDLAEADHVGEDDGGFLEMIRDIAVAISQARDDLRGKHVSQ